MVSDNGERGVSGERESKAGSGMGYGCDNREVSKRGPGKVGRD